MAEREKQLVFAAAERYPRYYPHAENATLLFSNFLKSIDRDRFVFAMFLSLAKKHHTLALLSTVRLHRVQAMMDLRQVLEAGASAAFAIANPEQEHFVQTDDLGILEASQKLAKKRHAWLDEHYPGGSKFIKREKEIINPLMAHANLLAAQINFETNHQRGSFEMNFFDAEDAYLVKSDLWLVGNIAIGLLELFYGVNQGPGVIKFADEFESRLSKLSDESETLAEEMKQDERYRQTEQFLQAASSTAPDVP